MRNMKDESNPNTDFSKENSHIESGILGLNKVSDLESESLALQNK